MSSAAPEPWSLTRSLAFLAAVFAIVFGALTPAAVAASPAVGQPIVLCSGDSLTVTYDADGQPVPVEHDAAASLTCAMALLSGLDAAPPAPPVAPLALAGPQRVRDLSPLSPRALPIRLAPRPPSTAPPLA